MKKYSKEDVIVILEQHRKLLNGEEGGKRADFSGGEISGMNLSFNDIRHASFSGCKISNVNMSFCDFFGTDFNGAVINDTHFYNSSLHGVKMANADLCDVSMYHARLCGDVKYSKFTRVDFSNTRITGCDARFIENDGSFPITREELSDLHDYKFEVEKHESVEVCKRCNHADIPILQRNKVTGVWRYGCKECGCTLFNGGMSID